MLGNELDYYKEAQKEMRKKYKTTDDHKVTILILREMGVDQHILHIVTNFDALDLAKASSEMEAKICDYGDSRVGPQGILPLQVRFEDLISRRAKDSEAVKKWRSIEDACLKIEKEIISHTALKPEYINEDTIKPYLERFNV